MTNTCKRSSIAKFCLFSFAIAGYLIASANSSFASADDNLPSAEKVLAKYIEATGGQAAYDKIKNRVTKSNLTIIAAGLDIETTRYAAKPNKGYLVAEAEMVGKIEQGTDGKVSWTISDQVGANFNEGEAHESFMALTAFDSRIYWKKNFTDVKCTGVEKVGGKDCYVVTMTPTSSNKKVILSPVTNYFNQKTGLLIKVKTTLVAQQGEFPVESIYSDYRKVDGIKIPFQIEQNINNQDRVMTIESVKHNVKMEKDRFDLPDEIKELLKKDK